MKTKVIKYKLYTGSRWRNDYMETMRYDDAKVDVELLSDILLESFEGKRYFIESIDTEKCDRFHKNMIINVMYESSHIVKIKRFKELVEMQVLMNEI